MKTGGLDHGEVDWMIPCSNMDCTSLSSSCLKVKGILWKGQMGIHLPYAYCALQQWSYQHLMCLWQKHPEKYRLIVASISHLMQISLRLTALFKKNGHMIDSAWGTGSNQLWV